MNEVIFSKKFLRSYKRRVQNDVKLSAKFDRRFALFRQNNKSYPLNDHALVGKLAGKRVFSVSADVRVVYEDVGGKLIFLDIGSHNQVY